MTENTLETINEVILNSPWNNTYWFARMLLNGDQYGAIGKKDAYILKLINELETIISQSSLSEQDKFSICRNSLIQAIKNVYKEGSKSSNLAENFAVALEQEITSLKDIIILIITIRYIVLPINSALTLVPNDDKEFCYSAAKHILDSLGERNVGKVLSVWDELGVKGCLNVERVQVVTEFTKLRRNLEALSIDRTEIEDHTLLTAFVQEFERRLGQKRKSRAGTSLEDVATFLFDYYNFTSHPKPDHFQTDIEVDKWFKCSDGWSIGISCKRTLRERWKQVSSADGNVLSRYKIKEIWHLTTHDKDLSDDKITMLGQQRQIFYLDDMSDRYRYASTHIGMKEYVRPLSQLIADIRKEQGK